MLSQKSGHFLRWVGWSLFWMFLHPEVVSLNTWLADTSSIVPGILTYLITGLVLEFCYRKLVWGSLRLPNAHQNNVCPECIENPWISLSQKKPHHESKNDFELFCVDGIVRPGTIVYLHGKGYLLATKLTSKESVEHQQNSVPFRPTHWRYCKENINVSNGSVPL